MPTPSWWPQHATPIPTYEHLIAGTGRVGIGMHRDRYVSRTTGATPTTAPERLMSTYISLARGVKHVVLLPPTQEGGAVAERLGGNLRDEPGGRHGSTQRHFPMRPPPTLLAHVVGAGGYWFDIGAPTGDAGSTRDDPRLDADVREYATPSARAVCVFIPAGWWHWLLSDSEWHVAWSGSFFPDADREARS